MRSGFALIFPPVASAAYGQNSSRVHRAQVPPPDVLTIVSPW